MKKAGQAERFQQQTLDRLSARIPFDCPLLVERVVSGGFRAWALDTDHEQVGRFQVVAAWIDGFIAAWDQQI
jgi:hypothetical protein